MIIVHYKNHCISYPLDKFNISGIFKLAKTTRPVSLLKHGGLLYYGI